MRITRTSHNTCTIEFGLYGVWNASFRERTVYLCRWTFDKTFVEMREEVFPSLEPILNSCFKLSDADWVKFLLMME